MQSVNMSLLDKLIISGLVTLFIAIIIIIIFLTRLLIMYILKQFRAP